MAIKSDPRSSADDKSNTTPLLVFNGKKSKDGMVIYLKMEYNESKSLPYRLLCMYSEDKQVRVGLTYIGDISELQTYSGDLLISNQ